MSNQATIKVVENKVNLVTVQQAKALRQREYNPSNWDATIESYLKYENVVLYTTKGSIYENDLFAIYTLESGLRLRQEITHSSMLSNGGFTLCSLIDNKLSEYRVHVGTKRVTEQLKRSELIRRCKLNPLIFYSK